jgi:hypothetical protein
MIACIIIVGLAFIWLGYETNWLKIKLGEVYIMRLPSGALITEEDLDFLTELLKPVKTKKNGYNEHCWYCGNGHDMIPIEDIHPYKVCSCGASIVPIISKRKPAKSRYSKLASEFARAIGAPKRNPKVMI